MADFVMNGVRITSSCYCIETGEEKPFEECREDFIKYMLSVSKVTKAPEGYKPTPAKDADYLVVLNKEGGRHEVVARGEPRYQEILDNLI